MLTSLEVVNKRARQPIQIILDTNLIFNELSDHIVKIAVTESFKESGQL